MLMKIPGYNTGMTTKNISNAILAIYAALATYSVLGVLIGIGYHPILTPISSLLAFSFAILHSSQRLGWKRTLLLLMCTFIISLTFESIGVATGWVYGSYHYTDKLGFKFLGLVPLLIPVAWFMMSYPSFILAARILPSGRKLWLWRLSLAALGAAIMTAWDLAMDPMMVAAGHWVWDQPGAYFNIPLQNYAGWWFTIFVAFFLFLIIGRLTPAGLETREPAFERFAIVSYIIAGFSSVVMDYQIGLGGPALVGLFSMAPWVILGWMGKSSTSPLGGIKQ